MTVRRPPLPIAGSSLLVQPKVKPASVGIVAPAIPKVLNKRRDKATPGAVYIGRPSAWGNPFSIGVDGSREEVIEKFRAWVLVSTLMDHLDQLKGRDLICWCAPLACHGDILLDLANGGSRYRSTEI